MTVRRLALFGALLSLTGIVAQASSMDAMVKEVSGKVEFAVPSATAFKPLSAGATLPSGSVIRTGVDGVALLVPVRGTAIRLAPDTQITVSNMDFAVDGAKVTSRKADIDLTSGTLTALLDESISADVTDFKIHTPQGIAAARGTFFAITVHNDKAYIKVKAGKVGIQSKVTTSATGQASYLSTPVAPGV